MPLKHAVAKTKQDVQPVKIGYRVTLSEASSVEVISSHQDPSLERYPVRVFTGGVELALTVAGWASQPGEIGPILRQWIFERVHLEKAKLRKGCRRSYLYRVDAWRRVHPWR